MGRAQLRVVQQRAVVAGSCDELHDGAPGAEVHVRERRHLAGRVTDAVRALAASWLWELSPQHLGNPSNEGVRASSAGTLRSNHRRACVWPALGGAGAHLTPPSDKSAHVCLSPTRTAETAHVATGAHGETTASPGAGQASSPAATPTLAASTSSATHVPPTARAPEKGMDSSQRARPADGCARTRRGGGGMPTLSSLAPAQGVGVGSLGVGG